MTSMSVIGQWSASIRESYGVDPRIFSALVAVTIPPFYVAFAIAVRAALGARKMGQPLAADWSFLIATSVGVAAWLLPYAYVAAFGRLSAWAWAVFLLIFLIGAARLVLSLRRRSIDGSPYDTEVADD